LNNKILLLILFIISEIALLSYIDKYYEEKKLEVLEQDKKTVLNDYTIITDTFRDLANSNFLALVEEREDVKQAFANRDRKQLYNLLKDSYEHLRNIGFRQIHFHLPNSDSFLRMHKPNRYGDNLSNIRYSVNYTNQEKILSDGIETGRVLPGYRFVYPINYKSEHIGSVEFSFDISKIVNDIEKIYDVHTHFLIEKKLFNSKVFKEYKQYYTQSKESKNYIQLKRDIKSCSVQDLEYSKEQLDLVKNNITKGVPFSLEMDNHHYSDNKSKHIHHVVTFLPIKNIQHNETLYFVFYKNSKQLKSIEKAKFNKSIVFPSLLILIFIVLYMLLLRKEETEKSKYKMQKLIDAQDNIVILTDGKIIQFANKKFFDFFKYENLSSFLENHKCICELFFDNNDRFFHLGKIDKDDNWIEEIQKLQHSDRIVMIMGPSFILHSFSVTLNHYDDGNWIISFSDISQTMINQINLENKVVHDKLTGAFNREYFEGNIERLINTYDTTQTKLAIALLDIDHFKSVNDTYGHDVGDEVLIHFVNTIHKYSRTDDVLIRWGGEEFIFILKVKSNEDLNKALEHLRKTIELQNFPAIGKKTCSIGATIFISGEDIYSTIKRADEAVYTAKENGRNKVVLN
jgi:diguanylate cyclase (GGDEF)-like protein